MRARARTYRLGADGGQIGMLVVGDERQHVLERGPITLQRLRQSRRHAGGHRCARWVMRVKDERKRGARCRQNASAKARAAAFHRLLIRGGRIAAGEVVIRVIRAENAR